MENWCNNNVIFSGDPTRIKKVYQLFQRISEKQDSGQKLWLPKFINAKTAPLFDLRVDQQNIYYRSRWSPNMDALFQIANRFQVDFVNRYDEHQANLFGEFSYIQGQLSGIYLDGNDLKASNYDPKTLRFTYDNQSYPDEWPILVQLLEQKKFGSLYLKTISHLTKEELSQRYGELTEGDLVLKFAEHKDFDQAREVFNNMNDQTIVAIDNFLENTHKYRPGLFATRDKFLAFHFLQQLIQEWKDQQRDQRRVTGYSR